LRGSGRFEAAGAVVARPLEFQSPSLRGSGRFGFRRCTPRSADRRVSIPFIAGQWSLLGADLAEVRVDIVFQSPSLRGSGRFLIEALQRALPALRFNPLHCGAVVASAAARPSAGPPASFQSPSLRGSGRFARRGRGTGPQRRVSIPFIAGQWSLLLPFAHLHFLCR